MLRLAVLISGRGSNLSALLEKSKLPGSSYKVEVVLSDQPQAKGLLFAQENGIPSIVVERRAKEIDGEAYNRLLVEALSPFSPDLVVLAGFMRIVREPLISFFKHRIINIHPSLLPSFKGVDAQAQALASGVKLAGCSVHFVEESVDGGPIIAQAAVPVRAGDSPDSLSQRILRAEHQLLPRVVEMIARNLVYIDAESNPHVVKFKRGAPEAEEPEVLFSCRQL